MAEAKSGVLEKLKVQAYEKEDFSGKPIAEYTVLFNPEKIIKNYQLEYEEAQAQGTSGTNLKFKGIKPEDFNLELVFDSTLVGHKAKRDRSNSNTSPEIESVPDQVKRFKETVLEFKGNIHSPPYVILSWGAFLFKGRLMELQITYTLFNSNGVPIRAKANAKFKGSLDDATRDRQEDKSSPDLTHVRIVQEGDTLPLMTYRIYGNSLYYLEVARVNQLDDFRNIRAGDKLIFPPLDKSTL